MSTAIARNLMADMKLLGMLGAFEIALLEAGHAVQIGTGAKAALEIFLAEPDAVPA